MPFMSYFLVHIKVRPSLVKNKGAFLFMSTKMNLSNDNALIVIAI